MSQVIILTGMSGAGKTTALFAFEEMKYYCIENVPEPLYEQLFALINSDDARYQKSVIVVNLSEAEKAIKIARSYQGLKVQVLGLVATEDALLSRYKLTRNAHPLQTKGSPLSKAIKEEERLFALVHEYFDYLIDTTNLSVAQFRQKLFIAFLEDQTEALTLSFVSFGYKHGIPSDIDLIIDARILPNPYWDDQLKGLTGFDQKVVDYVFKNEIGEKFLENVKNYVEYYLSFFMKESRPFYTIGIGCTGGQHRSVAVAEYLRNHFKKQLKTIVSHRDLTHVAPYKND